MSMHYITDSRAKRIGARVSFRENAFRSTIGGPIDSKVHASNSSNFNGIPTRANDAISDVEGTIRRQSDFD